MSTIPFFSFGQNFGINYNQYCIPFINQWSIPQINTSIFQDYKEPKFIYTPQNRSNQSNFELDFTPKPTKPSKPKKKHKIGSSIQSVAQTSWEKLGYCAKAGKKLAKTALHNVVGFIGYCATYVKQAIEQCGLGKYVSGHACDMIRILSKNKKFKRISANGVNLKTLPAGCVLVYDKGVAGYSSQHGHVEISTGDGRCVSDGITRNPRGVPTAIFIPVAA